MAKTATEIFTECETLDGFRQGLMALKGNFAFDADDMAELGKAYLGRYPDSFENRNSEHVLLGYELVRICITEKLAASCGEGQRDRIRRIFSSIPCIDPCVSDMIGESGRDGAAAALGDITRTLDEIRFTIETMKPGVIKERFIGGISKFYNIIYLIKLSMEKHA